MKKLTLKRCAVLVLTAAILFVQVFAAGITVLADDDRATPPADYPENCARKLGADLDYTGVALDGSHCYATAVKMNGKVNLMKYEYLEFDVFVVPSNPASEKGGFRFYVTDTQFKLSGNGRRFYDVKCDYNKWSHVKIASSESIWQNYGLNGVLSDITGLMVESSEIVSIRIANLCVTSSHIVSPDEMPGRLIATPYGKIYAAVDEETTQGELSSHFNSTDFTYGDDIEFDSYISSAEANESVNYVLKDVNGSTAVYDITQEANTWVHNKIKYTDFMADEGFDFTKVNSCYLDGAVTGNTYYFDNLCITGIATPKEYPENIEVKIMDKFDYDKKGSGGVSSITAYGATYDFSQYDFFEFDAYIESASASERIVFFLIDNTFTFEGATAAPGNAKKLQNTYQSVRTNEWVHVKMPVNNIGADGLGKGDITKIAGFYFTGLKSANRYLICNQSLSNFATTNANYSFGPIATREETLSYKKSTETTEKLTFAEALDVTAGKYFEIDIAAISMEKSVDAKLVLEDSDGTTVSAAVSLKGNEWTHIAKKLSDFNIGDNFDGIKSVYLMNAENSLSTYFYHAAISDIITPEFSPNYDLDETISLSGFDWTITGDQSPVFYFNAEHTPVNIREKEFFEYDACFETPASAVYSRIFFVDVNGKLAFIDPVYDRSTAENGWIHIAVIPSAADSGYGFNGDLSKIVGVKFMESDVTRGNGTILHIRNLCFSKFYVPEVATKYDIIKETNIKTSFSDIAGTKCLKTRSYINSDKSTFDLTTISAIEFDLFVEDKSHTSSSFRMYFIDETFAGVNEGRGFQDLSFAANKWVHMVVSIDAFNTGYGMNGNRKKTDSFMFESTYPGIFHIANLCLTKKFTLPTDTGEKEKMPDKDAKYISNCEELMNTLGVWNGSGIKTFRQYKTEDIKSVGITVRNQDDSKNQLRFMFEQPADFTEAKTIKFDMLVDDSAVLRMNDIYVYLTESNRFSGPRIIARIDSSKLVLGWNSIELAREDFTVEEGASWAKIGGIAIGLIDTNITDNDIYMTLCVDNLRVSPTFVAFEVEEDFGFDDDEEEEFEFDDEDFEDEEFDEEELDFDDFEDDELWDDEYFDEDEFDDIDEDLFGESKTTGKNGKRIVRHRMMGGSNVDEIVLIVVCCVVGAVFIAGGIVIFLTERKYRKLLKK